MANSNQVSSRFLNYAQALREPSGCSKSRPNDSPGTTSDVTDPASIRAAAEKFIERFGQDARNQANIRANELLLAGNIQGRTRWQLIGKEVEHLMENIEIQQNNTVN